MVVCYMAEDHWDSYQPGSAECLIVCYWQSLETMCDRATLFMWIIFLFTETADLFWFYFQVNNWLVTLTCWATYIPSVGKLICPHPTSNSSLSVCYNYKSIKLRNQSQSGFPMKGHLFWWVSLLSGFPRFSKYSKCKASSTAPGP